MNRHNKMVLAASLAVLLFLFWLIYGRDPRGATGWTGSLPALNAFLNGTTALLLIAGYLAIKGRHITAHIRFMCGAVATSALFLISYCIYHYYHGHTVFQGTGLIRPFYFTLLISHILLSVVQVPLIGLTLLAAVKKEYRQHKRLARWTLPIWLYVSATGVAVFLFLRLTNSQLTCPRPPFRDKIGHRYKGVLP